MSRQKFTLDFVTAVNVTGEVNVLVEYEKTEPNDLGLTEYVVTIALSDRPHFKLEGTYSHGCCIEGFGGPDDVGEWLDDIISAVENRLFELLKDK